MYTKTFDKHQNEWYVRDDSGISIATVETERLADILLETLNDVSPMTERVVAHCQKIIAAELLEFTNGCRDDFHEPDQQDIYIGEISGNKLDNAFGTGPFPEGYSEVVVALVQSAHDLPKDGDKEFKINLADLIALAMHGARTFNIL